MCLAAENYLFRKRDCIGIIHRMIDRASVWYLSLSIHCEIYSEEVLMSHALDNKMLRKSQCFRIGCESRQILNRMRDLCIFATYMYTIYVLAIDVTWWSSKGSTSNYRLMLDCTILAYIIRDATARLLLFAANAYGREIDKISKLQVPTIQSTIEEKVIITLQ